MFSTGGLLLARPWLTFTVVTAMSVAAAVISPLLRQEEWVGWFPTTIGAIESAAVWVPSVFGAAAAWISGQARTHGLREWSATSPRSRAQRLAPTMAFLALSSLVSQVVILIPIVGLSLHYGLLDGLAAPYMLLSIPTVAGYLLFWIAIGSWLGSLLRREIALPLAALLPYTMYVVMVVSSDGPMAALAIGDSRVFAYVQPSTGMVLTRTLFWLFAPAALWAALMAKPRISRVTTAWATSLAAALALFQGAALVPIRGASDAVCQGNRPTTCLEASFETTMGRYRAAIAELWPSIPEPIRPSWIGSVNDVLPGRGRALIVAPVAGYTEPARLIDRTMFAARLGDALFLAPCATTIVGGDAAISLVLWWRIQHDVPIDGSAFVGDVNYPAVDPKYEAHSRAARAFGKLSPRSRSAWFQTHADGVLNCTIANLADES